MGKAPKQQTQRQLRTFRLFLILPFVVAALLVAPLALLKKSAEVEISLKVSRLSFVIGQPSLAGMFNAVQVQSLTLLNFHEVELGFGRLEVATAGDPHTNIPSAWQPRGQHTSLRLTPKLNFASLTLEEVKFNQLQVPRQARLTFWHEEGANSLRLRVEEAEPTGHLVVGRTLHLSCTGCEVSGLSDHEDFDSKALRFVSERDHVVAFRGRNEGITLALEFPPGAGLAEEDIPLARDLKFTQMEGRRQTSTIIGDDGKIVFAEMAKEIGVRAGDLVILDELRGCFLRSLHLDNGIRVALHGRVGSLAVGPSGAVKNLSPSLLEWLYQGNQTLMLYLNVSILVGTMALAILTRLKIVPEEEEE